MCDNYMTQLGTSNITTTRFNLSSCITTHIKCVQKKKIYNIFHIASKMISKYNSCF